MRVAESRNSSSSFWALGLAAQVWCAAVGILLSAFTGSAAQQPKSNNVLVLFSILERDTNFLDSIEATMRARVPGHITFYDAYLEYAQVEEKSYRDSQAETFRRTYAGVKIDLVITNNPEALHFAVEYRNKIFPGVPIVFTEVGTSELEGQEIGPEVTGVSVPVGLRETIDLALHLHPDTNSVAVISRKNGHWLGVAHSELLRYQDKVREIDLVGPPSGQLLEKVAALPPHTVVLFQLEPQTSNQPTIGAWDVLAAVAERLPTYSAWPSLCLNHGCIGGAYPDAPKERLWTAEIAARVLLGERPENIPVVHDSNLQVQVDWRALRRWHIPESALPPGSTVLYQEPTLWERGRKYFLAGIAVIVVQALLIFGLFWQRARKRKAEAVLRESEERFRVMADTTPSLIWMCDEEGKVTYLNDRRIAFTGRDPRAGYGDTWTTYIHPDDRKQVQGAFFGSLQSRQPFSREYRLRRRDGVYRWMFDVAAPRLNGDGSFAGFIGSAIDITEQKLAQETLGSLGGRLLEAQEEERRRIARELHDDISQKLALLAIKLAKANRNLNGSPEVTKAHLEEIQQHCSEIGRDVQSLSHQLHYSKLDYLGLVNALKAFCRESAQQYDVSIDFRDENVPKKLPNNVALCLFRVAQEALHNAVKYSGIKEFAVEVRATANEVQLMVRDDGAGFDVEEAKKTSGLGLLSMHERVHLVRGRFSIQSRPGEGTTIVATVPVSASAPSAATGVDQASVQGKA